MSLDVLQHISQNFIYGKTCICIRRLHRILFVLFVLVRLVSVLGRVCLFLLWDLGGGVYLSRMLLEVLPQLKRGRGCAAGAPGHDKRCARNVGVGDLV